MEAPLLTSADLWRIILYHKSADYFPSYNASHKRRSDPGIEGTGGRISKMPIKVDLTHIPK